MNRPLTYEIVIRGRATQRVLGNLVDDFTIDHPAAGHTRLTGTLLDPAHLHGVLAYLTSMAIDIISVNSSEPSDPSQPERPTA